MPPTVDRPEVPRSGDERTLLDAWLDWHRATLLMKCAGLTEEQLRERSAPPSTLSLLGLVRHMAEVERWWFARGAAGQPLGNLYCSEDNEDGDFDDVDTADVAADFATFQAEVERARKVCATTDLEHTFLHGRRTRTFNLRWVYVHMIEEYARHNGHADLLRERIDGATGE
jgi:uncharacterized damage-inducible protein DinB